MQSNISFFIGLLSFFPRLLTIQHSYCLEILLKDQSKNPGNLWLCLPCLFQQAIESRESLFTPQMCKTVLATWGLSKHLINWLMEKMHSFWKSKMRNNSKVHQPYVNLKMTRKNYHCSISIITSYTFFINWSAYFDLVSKPLYPSFGKMPLNFAYSQTSSVVGVEPTPSSRGTSLWPEPTSIFHSPGCNICSEMVKMPNQSHVTLRNLCWGFWRRHSHEFEAGGR